MSIAITKDRWEEAQKEEIKDHLVGYGKEFYTKTYETIFSFLNLHKNEFLEKIVVEVGPAFYPALLDVKTKKAIIVEPLFDQFPENIKKLFIENNIFCISKPLEETSKEELKSDEIWLFNVLQHVIDPDLFLKKCMESSKIIRIFEPINWPTNIAHPHSFSFEYFENIFAGKEHDLKIYRGNTMVDFHSADCIYGTIKN